MIDESTKITALTNVGSTTKKAIKISTVEVVIWTLPKMGGPTEKRELRGNNRKMRKFQTKKPILFATIIIISLIAVENGIFLELLHLFMTFVLKHANNFLLLFYTLKKKCYSFKIPIMMILLSLVDILPLISLLQQFTFMGLCFPT